MLLNRHIIETYASHRNAGVVVVLTADNPAYPCNPADGSFTTAVVRDRLAAEFPESCFYLAVGPCQTPYVVAVGSPTMANNALQLARFAGQKAVTVGVLEFSPGDYNPMTKYDLLGGTFWRQFVNGDYVGRVIDATLVKISDHPNGRGVSMPMLYEDPYLTIEFNERAVPHD